MHRCFILWTIIALSTWEPLFLAAKEPSQTPLFEGLGTHGRKITTTSAEAQRYFDQGLVFLYGFNHDEAIRSFRRATELDPQCAMGWWCISLAYGPHINNPAVSKEKAQKAWEALTKARETAGGASPTEQSLVAALGKRYADPQPDDRKPLDAAYAAAMREIWKANPNDADIGALFAESLMDVRPWDLWTRDGRPQPDTEEIVATLEAVLNQSPDHPLALHLTIHALESSPHPEKADAAADRLRTLVPGLGHLVHMPSHLDVRRGRWAQAIETNALAIEADRQYRRHSPQQGFYQLYMAHNQHMLAYAAMMRGQSVLAIATINDMVQAMPPEWIVENAALADGFLALPIETLVRFGRWEQVLAMPQMPKYLPVAGCLRHAARGIAYSARGEIEKARAEQEALVAGKSAVKPEAVVGNNKAHDVLAVAERLLSGEILYREGKVDEGLAALREAVKLEDQLRYSEPPDWMHPVRHSLGATLLREGRAAEAAAVYREDLAKLPENGWSLLGLARSLHQLGKPDDAAQVEARFQQVWSDADISIRSSCYCQP